MPLADLANGVNLGESMRVDDVIEEMIADGLAEGKARKTLMDAVISQEPNMAKCIAAALYNMVQKLLPFCIGMAGSFFFEIEFGNFVGFIRALVQSPGEHFRLPFLRKLPANMVCDFDL